MMEQNKNPPSNKIRKAGTVSAACFALVAGFEGLRTVAYPDPATRGSPWTICYGSTEGIRPGDRRTVAECKALLSQELYEFSQGVSACIRRPMTEGQEAAYISLAYNIGTGAFCKSSVARLHNAGQDRAACDAILKWNRAAGVVFPGLTRRRVAERKLCLQ